MKKNIDSVMVCTVAALHLTWPGGSAVEPFLFLLLLMSYSDLWLRARQRKFCSGFFTYQPIDLPIICFKVRAKTGHKKMQTPTHGDQAAAAEAASLSGCAGQQSDNGWRGLVEPAVPLGFVNVVRGGWRGSSAFISTFRDTHSSYWTWPASLLPPSLVMCDCFSTAGCLKSGHTPKGYS